MRKFAGIFLVCLALGTISPAMAEVGKYVVQPGDTLWTLSGDRLGNPEKWGELIGLNPFLKEYGRQFVKPDGTIVVRIRPGEHLAGLEQLGITAEPLPLDQLVVPPLPIPLEASDAPPPRARFQVGGQNDEPASTPVSAESDTPFWYPWLFALLVIVAACVVWWGSGRHAREQERERADQRERDQARTRERERAMDPVITSAPPIVAGGIPPTEPERLADHFERRAQAVHVGRTEDEELRRARPERIGPIEEGMISGRGMVGYADFARPRTINPPLSGYQARFRFPDGREELLLSLMACMNPCMWGEGMTGFTFTPGRVVVPAPEPTAQPPAPPTPPPTVAVRNVGAADGSEGLSTLTIGEHVMTFAHGIHFTVDTVTGDVVISSNGFEMVVRPTAPAQPAEAEVAVEGQLLAS